MTNEQAKREIENIDYYLQNHTDDYGERSHDAMLMAIKALQAQNCDTCEVGNPCLYCKHEFEPQESEDKE